MEKNELRTTETGNARREKKEIQTTTETGKARHTKKRAQNGRNREGAIYKKELRATDTGRKTLWKK